MLLEAALTYHGLASPAAKPSKLPTPGATNVIAFANGNAIFEYGPGTTFVASVVGLPEAGAGPAPSK